MDVATQSATAPAAATDTTDQDLLALAAKADAGESIEPQQSEPAPDTTKTDTAPAAAESAKAETDQPADKQTKDTTEAAKETPFQKAKSEAERRDRSWKSLNEEKEKFRQERQSFETERKKYESEIQRLRAETETRKANEPITDERGHTAETYDRVAAKAEADGDADLAKLAKEQAAALRQKEAARPRTAAPAQQGEAWQTPEFQEKWKANVAEIIQSEPELNDPNNPVFQTVKGLVNDANYSRFFRAHPDGIKAALEVAKLQQRAAVAEKTTAELKTAKAEIERLNKLLAPRGGPPAGQAPARRAEDISDEELLAAARAADRGA